MEIDGDIKDSSVDFVILDINTASELHTGIKAKDAIGMKLSELFKVAGKNRFIQLLCKVLKDQEPIYTSQYYETQDIHYSIHAYPVSDKRVTVVFSNITDKTKTEREARDKSEELDRYFTTSLDLLCITNMDGKFMRLNPEWKKVLGYSLKELEGKKILDFVHPDEKQITETALARINSQVELVSFENRVLSKNGVYLWIEWRAKPLSNMIYAAARDITSRKQAEDRLRESMEYSWSLIESIPDTLIILDKHGTFLDYKAEKIDLFSDYGDFLGKNIKEVVPPPSCHR